MEESINQQRKGSTVSHTISQLDHQAKQNQCGASDETRQAQGRELVDRAEPKIGDSLPSRSLAAQSGSTEPGVAVGESHSKRPSLTMR